jgi:integrase
MEALDQLTASVKGGYVFVTRRGTPLRSIKTAFETACRHANLVGVTPHTLRHTFASKLAKAKVGDRTLQALGRCKEPKMIQRYAHLSEGDLREAVEAIGKNSPTESSTPLEAVAAK